MSIVRRLRCAAALAMLWPAIAVVHAQQGGDVQAQILYAYQTEDGNGLASVIQSLTASVKDEPTDAALRYHLAHAQYRMGMLTEAKQKQRAAAAYDDCINALKPLTDADVKSVEAAALQGGCYQRLAALRFLEAVVLRARGAERLKSALQKEPRNPRALLIAAQEDLARAKPGSPERQHGFDELKLAVQLFEQSAGTNLEAPGWGHAEAYLAYGRELLVRGDHLGARNWIEKALIAAPDFKAAQRQAAQLARP